MLKLILTAVTFFAVSTGTAMEFYEEPSTTGTVTLRDGSSNVYSYNYGDKLPAGVNKKFIRSGYIHPLWAPDGEVLTDDFPADHFHHHGIFWGWPIVKVRSIKTDNWMHGEPSLRPHFVRWTEQTTSTETAVLGIENRWLLGEQEEVAREHVTITAHQEEAGSRAIDVKLVLEAVGEPLTLQGSQEGKKGYGGFSWRASPNFKGSRISTSSGIKEKDIMMERAKWSALTGKDNGLAVFVAPGHPDYPPYSFARNSYTGFLNTSWPGLEPVELLPGKPVTLQYRLYIHKGTSSTSDLESAYKLYEQHLQQPISN